MALESPDNNLNTEETITEENEIEIVDSENEEVIDLEGKKEEGEGEEEETSDFDFTVPVSRQQIEKEFPEFGKKFPHVFKTLQREKQYAEIFPIIEDAREAKEKLDEYDSLQNDLKEGSTEAILKNIKDSDPGNFDGLVNNYLSNLNKVDREAYLHVVGNVLSDAFTQLHKLGKSEDNKDLMIACEILNQAIFNQKQIVEPSDFNRSGEKKPEKNEREEFQKERFESKKSDFYERIDNSLKQTLDTNIDPNGKMSPYIKRTAISQALSEAKETIQNDKQFQRVIEKLWQDAKKANYQGESLQKIRNAELNKAKAVLPIIIKKVSKEALSGIRTNTSNTETSKGPVPAARPVLKNNNNGASSDKSKTLSQKEVPKGHSARRAFLFGEK